MPAHCVLCEDSQTRNITRKALITRKLIIQRERKKKKKERERERLYMCGR